MKLQSGFVLLCLKFILTINILEANDACAANLCAEQPNGQKIVDPSDCHGYFLCHGEVLFQQYCAQGSKFSVELQDCVVGKCPPCTLPPTPTTPSIPTPTPTKPTSTASNDPTAPDCSRYEHGRLLPHATHCRFFWQCVEGRAVRRICEKDMWYDRENFVCNSPANVQNCPARHD